MHHIEWVAYKYGAEIVAEYSRKRMWVYDRHQLPFWGDPTLEDLIEHANMIDLPWEHPYRLDMRTNAAFKDYYLERMGSDV